MTATQSLANTSKNQNVKIVEYEKQISQFNKDLQNINLDEISKYEKLNAMLEIEPPNDWIKKHPVIANWDYLPIGKVERLLRQIFKNVSIEIKSIQQMFNGVCICVRVNYLCPASKQMRFHDGVGAAQLQTKKGTSSADLINLNNGALTMAVGIAESTAIKDACAKFGALFGSNLNRKDINGFTADMDLIARATAEETRIKQMIEDCATREDLEKLGNKNPQILENELFKQAKNQKE